MATEIPDGRAAAYVRMSTEHQRYSTENQRAAIDRYAADHKLEIVRVYSDEGKSGLSLDGRDALKALINDVQCGTVPFKVVLVYDVSRWGRFQDADESAYYEYICKRAGLSVRYCAEQFENDGSPVSTIVKGVKRAMAGEYSRELSAKVFAGQSRLVEMGFRQGGPPGYGLKRVLLDQSGQPKGVLLFGEKKSIQTDRVILAPGPVHEVAIIREIFDAFVSRRRNEESIAGDLNSRGISGPLGHRWSRSTVHQVLISEKYIGNNVWNRVSRKLKQPPIRNDPTKWIRAPHVFEPIVSIEVFQKAQQRILERSQRLSNHELLEALKKLLDQHGMLSGLIIDEAPNSPSSTAYAKRFGSLLRAYRLVGFTPDRDYRYVEINQLLRRMHPLVLSSTIEHIERAGGWVQRLPSDLLLINDEFTVSIVIVRCTQTLGGSLRWKVRFDTGLSPDITVAVRMDPENAEALDYYLLPAEASNASMLRLSLANGISIDAFRFDKLDPLFDLAARLPLEAAA